MADTYSQIYTHIIFTVRGRENLIPLNNRDELFKYITGIVTRRGQKLIRINGMSDHLHILIGIKPSMRLSDLVRDIKSNSSKFITDRRWVSGKFSWQNGFGAFSYGHSQLDRVIQYIDNQEKHHKKSDFKGEYLTFLKLFNVPTNEKYLFKWIE